MPRLLSGSTIRRGGSGDFIDLKGAQPQLPPSDTTATGFTLVTDPLLRTSYRSSLGFIEFTTSSMYSALPQGTIKILATGSTFLSLSTTTGNLVVQGGIGVGGNMHIHKDIVVNSLTIGRGFDEGINNIVITGTAVPQIDDFNTGQETIAIGYDALQGIDTSYKNIAIGRYALNSGTNLSNNIAIGDSALRKIGYAGATPFLPVSGITNDNPIVVTSNNHGLSSGTWISFSGVTGITALNGGSYYIKKLNNNQFSLYNDNILSSSVNGNFLPPYTGGGTIDRYLLRNNNIAIGNNAGKELIDGEKNFFIGDEVGKNLSTGSYNFLVGHDVGNNLTRGNYNIAIGGDNLVDGLDNQVNIGSVFYYNGLGDLQLNSDAEVGLGSIATVTPPGSIVSTSTFTGGLVVIGGLVVTENAIINKDVQIFSSTPSTSSTSGGLIINGGVGIGQNLNVAGDTDINGSLTVNASGNVTLTPQTGNVVINSFTVGSMDNIDIGLTTPRFGQFIEITATVKAQVLGLENAISTNTGAFTVAGGVGIGKDLWVGGNIYGPGLGNLGAAGNQIFVNTATDNTYYLGLTQFIGTLSSVFSTSTVIYNNQTEVLETPKLKISNTLSNTVTNIDQALVVNGGAYVNNGIYSQGSGNPNENNLVYTPVIYVSTTTPANARLGDFWIDPTYGVELQYIQDGSNKVWIQFAGL